MTIVTHKKPHIDEIVAIWLLCTFDPKFKDCAFEFVSYSPSGKVNVSTGSEYVGVGIGRGKYDEHAVSHETSSTKLVYEDLMRRGMIPNVDHEDRALEWLVDYAHKEDTAQVQEVPEEWRKFSIPPIVRGVAEINGDQAQLEFGLRLVDGLMFSLNERAKFLRDWEKRVEFDTPWGRAVALTSAYKGSDEYAYHHGFILRLQADPVKPTLDVRAHPHSQTDLTKIYEIVNKQEPGSWYLHQSKRLLISNIDPSTGLTPTKMKLAELVVLFRSTD